ncbi:hypothetical protein COU80_03725 [Candidatus Peregrinibacteria bacterium CG10_big_fil_rev_8_21_14_0_10_55_24]|nr:MAG: hypothetical protein COU80_03725 [Candidatus Peregrinibacteria bacterium CG10_big_fil_rev_8_21_14_0_10_55_24]
MEGALSSLDTRNYDTDLDGGRSDESQMSVRIEEAETEGTIAEQAALAREKIAEGTYGVCDDCDEEIPIGRLEVIPYATRCAHCQTQEEQQPPQQELRKRRRYKVKQRER